MIKINLLAAERKAVKRAVFQAGQKLTIGCSAILIIAALFVGWRYWSIQQQSAQLDKDISEAQQETTRLHAIIQNVQQFEQRKAQLQQRVVLIEQLRKSQTGPVHMLDEISRALPPMLWLTSSQTDRRCRDHRRPVHGGHRPDRFRDEPGGARATSRSQWTLSAVQIETLAQPPVELIKFSIKAQFQQPRRLPKQGGKFGQE